MQQVPAQDTPTAALPGADECDMGTDEVTDFKPEREVLNDLAAEQDSIGMIMDSRPFVREVKPDLSQLRLQTQFAQSPLPFRPNIDRGEQAMMMNPWMSSMQASGFIEPSFSMHNRLISPSGFSVDNMGLMQDHQQPMTMPLPETTSYRGFSSDAHQPAPVRAMSTPNGNSISPNGMHGWGMGPGSYFGN